MNLGNSVAVIGVWIMWFVGWECWAFPWLAVAIPSLVTVQVLRTKGNA